MRHFQLPLSTSGVSILAYLAHSVLSQDHSLKALSLSLSLLFNISRIFVATRTIFFISFWVFYLLDFTAIECYFLTHRAKYRFYSLRGLPHFLSIFLLRKQTHSTDPPYPSASSSPILFIPSSPPPPPVKKI